jgi:cell division cycle 2-like
MASKSSRWAFNDADQAAAAEERKREKEEKRRLKEERARLAAGPAAASFIDDADDERPSKRRRTTPSHSDHETTEPVAADESTHLLSFPNSGFGPSGPVSQYSILNPIEEGSYGRVSRARANETGDIVALKKLKMDNSSDGFPVTALREIQTLKACSHPHIVSLREVVVGDSLTE